MREAALRRVPFVGVVGNREAAERTAALCSPGGEDPGRSGTTRWRRSSIAPAGDPDRPRPITLVIGKTAADPKPQGCNCLLAGAGADRVSSLQAPSHSRRGDDGSAVESTREHQPLLSGGSHTSIGEPRTSIVRMGFPVSGSTKSSALSDTITSLPPLVTAIRSPQIVVG